MNHLRNSREAHAALLDSRPAFENLHRIAPNSCSGSCRQVRGCDCVAEFPEPDKPEPRWVAWFVRLCFAVAALAALAAVFLPRMS